MAAWLSVFMVLVGLLPTSPPSRVDRQLTLDERLSAQRRIEQVYYSHLTGATRPFDQVYTPALLERKVRDALKMSAALDKLWNEPVTSEMLRAEALRIAVSTRIPERLRELHAALDNDPILIQECLVRPVLVDRLVRARFASDTRYREWSGKPGGWESWWASVRGSLDEAAVSTVARSAPALPAALLHSGAELAVLSQNNCSGEDSWVPPDPNQLAHQPPHRAMHTAVWTGTVMIAWGGLDGTSFTNTGEVYDPVTDTVRPTGLLSAPAPRGQHAAVWTGAEMVVWGGNDDVDTMGTGGRYDPQTETWTPTSTIGAPSERFGPVAVWTGNRMIVWGGGTSTNSTTRLNTGGIYNPTTDTWVATSLAGAPVGRAFHTGVWTGSRMIVWGGQADGFGGGPPTNTGGRFDPVTNSWQPTTTTGAASPRLYPVSVWTGHEMIVWAGESTGPDGARYDPVADHWTPVSTSNAPASQVGQSAIWTGSVMVIWAGLGPLSNEGGMYDPVTDTWTPTSTQGAPPPDFGPAAVWTGTQMIVWGGGFFGETFPVAGRYDPAANAWIPTLVGRPPGGRESHTAIWTGTHMIVWGGNQNNFVMDDGGRYDATLDSWTPVSGLNAPAARTLHTAVWTGSHMIVWGGAGAQGVMGGGGRYDPVADSWSGISALGEPTPRESHTAVWTGSEMILWGGEDDDAPFLNTGARYNPVADVWTPTSGALAPSERTNHTAVWTGHEMLVWGGYGFNGEGKNDGARYDPLSNAWQPISLSGAPSERFWHTAVWGGSQMIVWGGQDAATGQEHDDGGRYDPASDTWSTVSLLGAPTPRRLGTSVWDGTEMVVWGGYSDATYYLGTGARYDPASDIWTPVTMNGAPTERCCHTAVWTGSQMIVWGGFNFSGASETAARYSPSAGADDDHDGFSTCQGDCNDTDPAVHPGAAELPGNTLDEDCDGARLCDPSGTWKSHGQFVNCVSHACKALVKDDAVTKDECNDLVAQAVHSGVGSHASTNPRRLRTSD